MTEKQKERGPQAGGDQGISPADLEEMFALAGLTPVPPESPVTPPTEQPLAKECCIPGLFVEGDLNETALKRVLRDEDYRREVVPCPSDSHHLQRPRLLKPEVVEALVRWVVGDVHYDNRSMEPALTGLIAGWSRDVHAVMERAAVANHDTVKEQLGPLYKPNQSRAAWIEQIGNFPVGTVETIIHALSPQPILGEFEMASVLTRLRNLVRHVDALRASTGASVR